MIHLYARVSTDKQENGREAQVGRLLDWVGTAPHRLHVDEDVSAYSTPLNRRPHGRQMCDQLQKGDTVVITKDDRAFRSLYDMAVTRQNWRSLGVHLEILDLPDAFKTPEGELFLNMKVAFGEYESRQHGQRKREVYAHKRKSGRPYSTTRPFGWLVTKRFDKGVGRMVLDGYAEFPAERALAQTVQAMRGNGMNWSLIADELICEGVRKPKGSKGEYYYPSDLKLLVRAAEAGFPKMPQGAWRDCVLERTQSAG